MQVDIAVPGTFHAFKLGRQLESRGSLRRIYTSYPKFATDTEEIPDKKVTHIRHPELIAQVGHRFPVLNDIIPSQWNDPLNRWKGIAFDKSVARKLKPAEDGLFLGFAGVCFESLQRANDIGLTTVVERSSAHIRTQKEILDKEYQKYDQGDSPISTNHVEREEMEYQSADYVITTSKFAQESFLDRGFTAEKVRCVQLGENIEGKKVGTKRENKKGKTTFLFAGKVDLQKGVQYLLEAWSMSEFANSKLLLAGKISENMKSIKNRYERDDTIRFLGWRDDIAEVYANSDVFVLPSLHDGFGMVVTEAMANELPVLISENTGAKDCVREGVDGQVVSIRDSEALAEAMQYMHNNPEERKQMGENARDHITSNFTEDDYGERIFSEYHAMISQ
jgi:glycosyltransferase involved in cell wall biosynthesis